jgi:hypothetical protein
MKAAQIGTASIILTIWKSLIVGVLRGVIYEWAKIIFIKGLLSIFK